MNRSTQIRFLVGCILLLSLMSPVFAISAAGPFDGKKHFKQGMNHEVAEQWDKAVEEFALAVADNPKNPEFRLHLTRALFNASQMFIRKGAASAKEKDYESAYTAFRRAYAYDPTNELARSEMERMVRLQKEVLDPGSADKKDDTGKVKMVQTGYPAQTSQPAQQINQKLEKLRDIPFPNGVDLQFIIKELARDLDLNVLFDTESFRTAGRKVNIELKNVTAARALDYIFLQEGLFFQKVGPRTIIVATQAQRTKFQQLVLRTFYLQNSSPKDIAKVVQTAIPAQPGRSQTIVLTDDATNSVTIRDTEENIRLIGKLISSLDKDRAEVVMDVSIYEVNKTDLLQLGNQVGTPRELANIGGTTSAAVGVGGNSLYGTIGRAVADIIPSVFGVGFVIPSANLAALQTSGNTKLIAQTQIHAFNNEDSSARIGQRVPVQSAQYVTGSNNVGTGVVSNVINYEQTGLTLKFKPLVFPNQDVQVAMEIESKDVAAGGTQENPIFTERTVKGTARIQNNKSLLLASVASGSERTVRSGLPWISAIPILGRLFAAPTNSSNKIDIVIAVTPRVIRAPAILPEDEAERPTGSLAVPTNNSLEAMIVQEDLEEQLALARRLPTSPNVQLPDVPADSPEYVKSTTAANTTKIDPPAVTTAIPSSTATAAAPAPTTTAAASEPTKGIDIEALMSQPLKPIDSSVKTLQLNQTADTSMAPKTKTLDMPAVSAEPVPELKSDIPVVAIKFGTGLAEMKAGEKIRIPVMIDGIGNFNSAVLGLKFDNKKVAIRTVSYGDVFETFANTAAAPFLNQNGKMYVSLISQSGKELKSAGTLAFIEVEALVSGRPEIAFDRDVVNILTAAGKNVVVNLQQ